MKKNFRSFLAFALLAMVSFVATPPAHAQFVSRGSLVLTCAPGQQTGDLRTDPVSNVSAWAGCTIMIFKTGTNTAATLYYNNTGSGSSLANPFVPGTTTGVTASTTSATAFLDDGLYDISVSFPSITSAPFFSGTLTTRLQVNSGSFNTGVSDYTFFVPATDCSAAVTGTAGTGNNTVIIDGSVPALKASSTNAGASNATFTCLFQFPASRLATGKGFTISDITYLYSVQTTSATSMVASTFKSFTAPTAAASETASSATLVDQCNTCVQTPAVASGNLTSVSAGQYYSEKVALGTALAVNTDLQTFVFTFQINQSAAAAQIVTSPGLYVHGTYVPL